jgi:hypothetical protein
MQKLLIGLTLLTISTSSFANVFMMKACQAFHVDPQSCYESYAGKSGQIQDELDEGQAEDLQVKFKNQFESIESEGDCDDYLADLDYARKGISNSYEKVAVFVSYRRVVMDFDNEKCSENATKKALYTNTALAEVPEHFRNIVQED